MAIPRFAQAPNDQMDCPTPQIYTSAPDVSGPAVPILRDTKPCPPPGQPHTAFRGGSLPPVDDILLCIIKP